MYIYQGIKFKTLWALVYWIYTRDHKIDIALNNTSYPLSNGKPIYFDFVSQGRYITIDTGSPDSKDLRYQAYKDYHVKVLSERDVNPMFSYIYKTYGRGYLKKFKAKTSQDFKRKIIETKGKTLEELKSYKHKNVRFHYVCSRCGKDVFTTYYLLEHFHDGLCKTCRKNLGKEKSSL